MARFALVVCLLIAALRIAIAAPAVFPPAGNVIESMKFDPKSDTAVLEVTCSQSAPRVYFRQEGDRIIFDMFDVETSKVVSPKERPDDLIAGWTIRRPHARRAAWEITLRYPVPASHITISRDDKRATVTLKRKFERDQAFRVTENVRWQRKELVTSEGYLLLNELVMDMKAKSLSLDIGLSNEKGTAREYPSTLVYKHGALAGVNGGFFGGSGPPLGIVVRGGRIITPHVAHRPPRTTFGITSEGDFLMDPVKVEGGKLVATTGTDWSKVVTALGGGPRLVKNGRIDIRANEEGLGAGGNDIRYRAARTVIALFPGKKVMLATFTGATLFKGQGILLDELARYLVQRGAVDAMCLDGGGSTSMAIMGEAVSRPPHSRIERGVPNALLVFDTKAVLAPSKLEVHVSKGTVPADGQTEIVVKAFVTSRNGDPVPDGTLVYFEATAGSPLPPAKTSKGWARVPFTPPPVPGPVIVSATCGFARGSQNILCQAGAAKRLMVRIEPTPGRPFTPPTPSPSPTASPEMTPGLNDEPPTDAPSDAPSETPSPTPTVAAPVWTMYKLDILVTDGVGNPVLGEPVTAEYMRAVPGQISMPEKITRATDSQGSLRFPVLTPPNGLMVKFTHPTLGSIEVAVPPPRT